jgi:hypothetical protein
MSRPIAVSASSTDGRPQMRLRKGFAKACSTRQQQYGKRVWADSA